ncbi:molybdenum cofactor biosynthesis protein A [endosymbiont of unidentified scaly snail isolate Monju]|nr:molybdenum cofactor biosynthesis protein A [endosymbiont of unidentified scaly snail isolate Monju]
MLRDNFGRTIDYLRLSVTDRCVLRCQYCMPKGFKDFAEPGGWLSFEELTRLVAVFARLGLRHLRLTGGEPLVRRDLPVLVRMLAEIPGLEDISLSSNCMRMEKLAGPLAEAGVKRLNVSLDSLRPERFREITGGGRLDKVLRGIEAAREAGMWPIKINTVAMKGFNDDEFDDLIAYCVEHGYALRFIETMPVGDTGRQALGSYLNLQRVRQELVERHGLVPASMVGAGPARYYRVPGSETRIGFITPISQHFCATCNRVRLSCEGDLFACLGDEHRYGLREPLRAGCGDEELAEHVLAAINLKPERHEFNERQEKVVRFMSMTGG